MHTVAHALTYTHTHPYAHTHKHMNQVDYIGIYTRPGSDSLSEVNGSKKTGLNTRQR